MSDLKTENFGQTAEERMQESLQTSLEEFSPNARGMLANSGRFIVIITGTLILIFVIVWQWSAAKNNKMLKKQEAQALKREALDRKRKYKSKNENFLNVDAESEFYVSEMSYQHCLSSDEEDNGFPAVKVQID